MMQRISILEKYLALLNEVPTLDAENVVVYAREITDRHRRGWRIPDSTYHRQREKLFYKDSLERESPYYVDLLKIPNHDDLIVVLEDLCNTMRIRKFY